MAERVAETAALIGMRRLNLVLLTSNATGVDLAAVLGQLPAVRSLTVVTTRVVPRQSLLRKLRRMYLHEGAPGLLQAALGRLRIWSGSVPESLAALVARKCPGATHIHCDDLHAPESLARLRALAPDLGVVFATYRLRPEVCDIPQLGCLNLHLGRAPEFRGSSPGFYEMLEGVPEIGITVHRVSEALDRGAILLQEVVPLDVAPPGNPEEYLKRYLAQVVIPRGIGLMARAVDGLAQGSIVERVQPAGRPPRRRATHRLKQELRRRVAERRSTSSDARVRELSPARN
jgi:folate-dependent phosphoribosylglycinamide formyltransferase PurN